MPRFKDLPKIHPAVTVNHQEYLTRLKILLDKMQSENPDAKEVIDLKNSVQRLRIKFDEFIKRINDEN